LAYPLEKLLAHQLLLLFRLKAKPLQQDATEVQVNFAQGDGLAKVYSQAASDDGGDDRLTGRTLEKFR